MAEQFFPDGTHIFKEGDEPGPIYYVERGMVRITKKSHRGQTVLGDVPKGGIFGEMGLIDDSPRMATATAIGDTVCSVTDIVQMNRKFALLGPEPLAFYGQMIAYIRGTLPFADRPPRLKEMGETAADRAAVQLLDRLPEIVASLQHPPPAILTLFEVFGSYIERRLPPGSLYRGGTLGDVDD